MYDSRKKKLNVSVKTDYSKRRRNKYIKEEKYKTYNLNDRYNNNYSNRNKEKEKKYLLKSDKWSTMLARTSNEGKNEIKPNSIKYQNYINPINSCNIGEKKHFKESDNYDYTTKTQITTLPGGIKRNKYEIKDDYKFQKPYNYSRLYKLVYDFNANINYEKDYNPITQGYNVNSFPTKERYYGSYRKGIKDHDIFNTKFYDNHRYLYDYNDN